MTHRWRLLDIVPSLPVILTLYFSKIPCSKVRGGVGSLGKQRLFSWVWDSITVLNASSLMIITYMPAGCSDQVGAEHLWRIKERER